MSLRTAFINNWWSLLSNKPLPDVYRSLDHFSVSDVELQRHLNERVKEMIGRDLSYAFYDVTNYFFEIDFPDGEDDLRKKGVSKEVLARLSPDKILNTSFIQNGFGDGNERSIRPVGLIYNHCPAFFQKFPDNRIVFATLKSPKAGGIACPEYAGYNDHKTEKEKDASLSVICYSKPPEASIGHCMVIVTNYELIENPKTHFFM